MALTEVVIADLALSRVGISQQITDVDGTLASSTDTTVELQVLQQHYPRCRNRLFEHFPWSFARKEDRLVQDEDLDPDTDGWGNEWDIAYNYPADCARLWRFINDTGNFSYNWGLDNLGAGYWSGLWIGNAAWSYVVRRHDSGGGPKTVILSNVANDDADMEYTELLTDAADFTEEYASALAWYIASEIALPLNADVRRREDAVRMFIGEMKAASATNSNQDNTLDQPDGEFVQVRGGIGGVGGVGDFPGYVSGLW